MGALVTACAAALAAGSLWVLLLPADAGRLDVALPDAAAPPGAPRQPSGPGAARHGSAARPPAAAGRSAALPAPSLLACLLAGAAVALLAPAPVGPVLGLVVVLAGPRLLARLEPRSVREQREQLVRDLPLVLDLLASCLAGGAALPVAADAVARAVGGPASSRLSAVGAALTVGAPPGEAWALLAGADPSARATDPLGAAARALGRAADGGAPVAAAVSRLAAEARADARSRGEQAARRVGVLAVAPLGLCFLPAFVLLGIVPVVVGLAGPLLATF